MKALVTNNFDEEIRYRLYRTVHEIVHPSISKRNISNYKVVVKDGLLPVLVFYPKRLADLESVIIYVPGEDEGSYPGYVNFYKEMAIRTDKLVVVVDYLNGEGKANVVNKIYRLVRHLYEEFLKLGIDQENIFLMGDSVGCYIMGMVCSMMLSKKMKISKMVMISPVTGFDHDLEREQKTYYDIAFGKRIAGFFKQMGLEKDHEEKFLDIDFYGTFPDTLVVVGEMDVLKNSMKKLFDRIVVKAPGSKYCSILCAQHGFLSTADDMIMEEFYKVVDEFLV